MKEQLMQWSINIGFALAILVAGYFAIKYGSYLLHKALTKAEQGRHALVVRFVTSVAEKVAWAFVLVMALEKLGVDVGPIIAGLGVTGFILGFAFQESLGSLASGLMIAINQPFKVGDFVSVAGNDGTITALDMMAVTLATPLGFLGGKFISHPVRDEGTGIVRCYISAMLDDAAAGNGSGEFKGRGRITVRTGNDSDTGRVSGLGIHLRAGIDGCTASAHEIVNESCYGEDSQKQIIL